MNIQQINAVEEALIKRVEKVNGATRIKVEKLVKLLHRSRRNTRLSLNQRFLRKLESKEIQVLDKFDAITERLIRLIKAHKEMNQQRVRSQAKSLLKKSKQMRRLLQEINELRPIGRVNEVAISDHLYGITQQIHLKLNGLYALTHSLLVREDSSDVVIEIEGRAVKLFESLIHDEERLFEETVKIIDFTSRRSGQVRIKNARAAK